VGIMDKIKNLFIEEEYVEPKYEVSEESKKIREQMESTARPEAKSVKAPKDDLDDIISERELIKSETTFKFPIIFEEEDIKEEAPIPKPVVHEEKKYVKPVLDKEVIKEVIEKPKRFTVSPVISPVYGILDKNYKKDEVVDREKNLEITKELIISFDTIRQKAYGTLEDDLEKELLGGILGIDEELEMSVDPISDDENINLLDDLNEATFNLDTSVEDYSDFGIEDKLDKSVEEKPKHVKKEDIMEPAEEENSMQLPSLESRLQLDEEPITLEPVIEEVFEETKEKDMELTEDLFNLIDSMYDNK